MEQAVVSVQRYTKSIFLWKTKSEFASSQLHSGQAALWEDYCHALPPSTPQGTTSRLCLFPYGFPAILFFFLSNANILIEVSSEPLSPQEKGFTVFILLHSQLSLSSPLPLQSISPSSPLTRFQASLLFPSTHNLVTLMSCLNSPKLGF